MGHSLAIREQIVFQTISAAQQRLDAARGDLEFVLAQLQLVNAISVYCELLTNERQLSQST